MNDGRTLIIPLDSALVWAEAYGIVAILVWAGFVAWDVGWGERSTGPILHAFKALALGLVIGLLWPLWAAFGCVLLLAAAS